MGTCDCVKGSFYRDIMKFLIRLDCRQSLEVIKDLLIIVLI